MTASTPCLAPPWSAPLKPQIEAALDRFLPARDTQPEPLHRALRYAVFTDGERLRPQLLLRVAQACGAGAAEFDLALRAACAVEPVHIASLVHDDLPCFDNAPLRRGHPTVHVLFGEARALLVGDALLTQSFEVLLGASRSQAARALRIGQLLARAAGSSCGLLASQELELDTLAESLLTESSTRYHTMKTGALFGMAAESGAIAAGLRKTEDWARLGRLIGQGYQLAHALQALPVPTAGPLAGPHGLARHCRSVLQRQLSVLAATVHEQIHGLAAQPGPLIEFLDALCGPFLTSAADAPGPPRPSGPRVAERGEPVSAAAPPAPGPAR
jgi:geranylgeranyl diphosphate synthase type II